MAQAHVKWWEGRGRHAQHRSTTPASHRLYTKKAATCSAQPASWPAQLTLCVRGSPGALPKQRRHAGGLQRPAGLQRQLGSPHVGVHAGRVQIQQLLAVQQQSANDGLEPRAWQGIRAAATTRRLLLLPRRGLLRRCGLLPHRAAAQEQAQHQRALLQVWGGDLGAVPLQRLGKGGGKLVGRLSAGGGGLWRRHLAAATASCSASLLRLCCGSCHSIGCPTTAATLALLPRGLKLHRGDEVAGHQAALRLDCGRPHAAERRRQHSDGGLCIPGDVQEHAGHKQLHDVGGGGARADCMGRGQAAKLVRMGEHAQLADARQGVLGCCGKAGSRRILPCLECQRAAWKLTDGWAVRLVAAVLLPADDGLQAGPK